MSGLCYRVEWFFCWCILRKLLSEILLRTDKLLFSHVDLQVHLQLVLVGKPLLTLGAPEGFLPRVDPLVPLQVTGLGEAHVTLGTAEGFLPCVDPLVDLHILGAAEAFVTEHAEEPFLFTIARCGPSSPNLGASPVV